MMCVESSKLTNTSTADTKTYWYVLRDLKRPNAKQRAYELLKQRGFEVFTPLVEKIVTRQGKPFRELVPFISDLLFVHTSKQDLNPVIAETETLQYRYVKGGKYQESMIVEEYSMNQFIQAVSNAAPSQCKYYNAEELATFKVGIHIRIVGGAFNGCVGELLSIKGSRKKRILLRMEGLFAASFEVNSEFIEVIK